MYHKIVVVTDWYKTSQQAQASGGSGLKNFFFKEESEDVEYNPFKNKSKWNPPTNRDIALETYIQAARRDILKSLDETSKRHSIDNLTKLEREAMFSLRTHEDIIFKRAD